MELHLGHQGKSGAEIRSIFKLADGVYDNPDGTASEATPGPVVTGNDGGQVSERSKKPRTDGGLSNQSRERRATRAIMAEIISGHRATVTVTR